MGRHDQLGIDAQAGLLDGVQIAAMALHAPRAPRCRPGRRCACGPGAPGAASRAGAQRVVRSHRAIGLVGQLGAPDHEAALGLGQAVEGGVQPALAQEDHAVGAAGGHGHREVLEAGRGHVADHQVAAPFTRRLTDPGQELEEERVRSRLSRPCGRGPRWRSCPRRLIEPAGNVAAERGSPSRAPASRSAAWLRVADGRPAVQRPRGGWRSIRPPARPGLRPRRAPFGHCPGHPRRSRRKFCRNRSSDLC